MSEQLIAQSQDLIVLDPSSEDHSSLFEQLEVGETPQEEVSQLLVGEPEEMVIEVGELPGAPPGPDPVELPEQEETLEVSDAELSTADDDESKKSKKNEKWDWESKGASGFVSWIKERIENVPKHSGYDSSGLERAMAYLEKLDNEISRAMRLDLDEELDANKIEEVRSKIDDGLARLQKRLNKVKKTKKSNRKKKSESDYDLSEDFIVKEAQKITGSKGVFVTVPLHISSIARICINGTVSAGHDLNETYQNQIKKYNLNERERAEVRWLLFDMGYPLRGDRGFMPDEDVDETSSDNFDFGANYGA